MNRVEKKPSVFTHEGGRAVRVSEEKQLRRSVMSCLLWEKEFYEDGQAIADRIWELCGKVQSAIIAQIAVEARSSMHLRHVPLLLLVALVRRGNGAVTEDAIAQVIQRVDEMAEFIALYWATPGNKHMIPHVMRRGLRRAIVKFDEYQLAKYDRDGAVKLRDVFRLVRPIPGEHARDGEHMTDAKLRRHQASLWKRAVKGELATPDTWEVALSRGDDKKKTFTRLLEDGNLGYFALLRNLRNMVQAGVDEDLVRDAIVSRRNGADRILPFRFIAAARAAPSFERELDQAMIAGLKNLPRLDGKTVVVVDVSGSMKAKLSGKSDLTRMDAAAALASIVQADKLRTYTFSTLLVEVPPRQGMAGVDAIVRSQPHGSTYLTRALEGVQRENPSIDRLIVITDEQSHDGGYQPWCDHAYLINVASARNGVGYGRWKHVDGFSENILRWIVEVED